MESAGSNNDSDAVVSPEDTALREEESFFRVIKVAKSGKKNIEQAKIETTGIVQKFDEALAALKKETDMPDERSKVSDALDAAQRAAKALLRTLDHANGSMSRLGECIARLRTSKEIVKAELEAVTGIASEVGDKFNDVNSKAEDFTTLLIIVESVVDTLQSAWTVTKTVVKKYWKHVLLAIGAGLAIYMARNQIYKMTALAAGEAKSSLGFTVSVGNVTETAAVHDVAALMTQGGEVAIQTTGGAAVPSLIVFKVAPEDCATTTLSVTVPGGAEISPAAAAFKALTGIGAPEAGTVVTGAVATGAIVSCVLLGDILTHLRRLQAQMTQLCKEINKFDSRAFPLKLSEKSQAAIQDFLSRMDRRILEQEELTRLRADKEELTRLRADKEESARENEDLRRRVKELEDSKLKKERKKKTADEKRQIINKSD